MFRTKKEVDKHVSDILNKIRNENDRNLRGYNFAKLYFQVKDFETAKRHLAGFLGIQENYAPAHKLLAEIYAAEGNLENALRSYKKSMELDNSQKDVILKICDIYCRLTCDPDTARYWAERAEKLFPHHETVFRLRECIVNAGGEPNRKELEELIQTELSFRPRDVSLRIKLMKLYLDSERTQEAYDYALKLEAKKPFPTNIDWYYCLVDVCEAYQEEPSCRLDSNFYSHFLVILDHLVTLLLAEPHAIVYEDVVPQHSRSIADVAAVLQTFDQQLYKAWRVGQSTDCAWRYMLQHMSGQLYLHFATLLLKRAKKDHGNWKEACRIGGALLLVAYSFKPGNLLEEAWFPKLGEKQQLYTELWQHATKRMTFAGYVLISLCREDEMKWLHRMKQEVCIPQVQDRTYQRLFAGLAHNKQAKDSYFLQDKTFIECSLEFPFTSSLLEYNKVTSQLYPSSLHHLTWLMLQLNARKTKQSELNFQLFPTLPYATEALTHGGPETLCQLDMDAFLCAVVHVTSIALEQRRLLARPHVADAVLCVPPDIADPLCTKEQGTWWLAAHALITNTSKDKHGEYRRVLRHGLEVIRGVYNHGMDVSLVVHLARTFADRASNLTAESADESMKDKALALSNRASHYWSVVIKMLDKKSSNQTVRIPRERLFKCETREFSLEEIAALREEGNLYLGTQKMRAEELEAAAEIFSSLNSEHASFNLAICLKKLAEDTLGEKKFHSLSTDQRNKAISLLTRARDSLRLTLDRMRGDKKHPLNSKLELEISEIEAKLLKAERGSVESIHSEDNAAETEEESAFLNISSDQNRNLSWLKSSPPWNKEDLALPKQGDIKGSSHKACLRPSPERLDMQICALAHKLDSFVQTILEQHNTLMETNKTLLKEIKEQKTAVEELKKQREELQKSQKPSRHRRQAHGHSSQMRSYNGTNVHEYEEYDEDGAQDAYYDSYAENEGADQNGESEYSDSYGLDHSLYMHDGVPPSNLSYLPPHHQYPYNYPPPPAHPTQPLHMGVPFQPPHGPPPPPRSYMPPPAPPSGHGFAFNHGQQMPRFRFPLSHPPPVPLGSSQVPPPPPPSQPPPHGPSAFGHLEPPSLSSQSGYFSPTPMQSGLTSQQPLWAQKTPLPTSAPHPFQIPLSSTTAATPTVPPAILSAPSISSSQPPSFLNSSVSLQPPNSADGSSSQSHVLSLLNSPTSSATLSTVTDQAASVSPSSVEKLQQSSEISTSRTEFSTSNGLLPDQSTTSTSTKEFKCTSDEESFDKEHEALVDFKPVVPLPAEVPVCTGEEGEKTLFEGRAKLFRFVEKEWKERGVGTVKLLLNEETGKVRFLMRRDQVLKVGANHYLLPNMALQSLKNNERAWIWAAQDFADEQIRDEKFCIRFKTADESLKFKEEFDKAIDMIKNWDTKKASDTQVNQITNKKEATSSASKDSQTLFVPIGGGMESTKLKGTTWNCTACHADNSPETFKCAACHTSKPTVIPQEENKGGSAVTPVSLQPPTFSFTSASSMLSQMASEHREGLKDSPVGGRASFGGFTFITQPVVKDVSSSITGQREIKVAGPKALEETKKGDEKARPFAHFVFTGTKPSVETKVDSSTDKPFFGSASNTGSLTFSSLSKLASSAGDAQKPEGFLKFSNSSEDFVKKSANGEATSTEPATGPEEFVPTREFQPVVSLPDLVEVKTGEEEEEKLFGEQAKLFRFDSDGKVWKERGVGELKILYNHSLGKSRILMRRDQVLKICANHYIVPGMKLSRLPTNERSWMWFANDFSEGELVEEKLAAKFKTVEIGMKFKAVFEKCQKGSMPESTDQSVEVTKEQTGFSEAQAKAQDLSDKQKKLSEIFKPKKGSWECPVCLVQNDANRVACVACEHSIAVVQKPPASRESDASVPMFKFGSLSTPLQSDSSLISAKETNSWKCTSCMNVNNSSENECRSCHLPKSSTMFGFPTKSGDVSGPQTFKFGIPADTLARGDKSDAKLGADIFKPSPGTWVCDACSVHNDLSRFVCAGCEASKPKDTVSPFSTTFRFGMPPAAGSIQDSKQDVSPNSFTPHSDTTFKTGLDMWVCTKCQKQNDSDKTCCVACNHKRPTLVGMPKDVTSISPQEESIVTSISSTNQGKDPGNQVPLSDLFKPSPGSWSCTTCYVRNDASKMTCVACNALKPGQTVMPKVTSNTGHFQGSFSFSSDTTKATDVDKQKQSPPQFGFTPSVFTSTPKMGDASPLTLASPIQPKQPQPPKVQSWSGFSNISKPDSDKNSTEQVFGSQLATKPESAVSPLSNKLGVCLFGSNVKTTSSAPGAGFVFSSTTAASPFSFNSLSGAKPVDLSPKQDTTSSEFVHFRFGSPQKYEFHFSGVRPKSPTKLPKLPGTPSDVSAEIFDSEVEASEADNIYFQPVCPLPPKVDVKTGEEEEKLLYCQRAKLFRFDSGEWKERGIGDLKILHNPNTGRVRLLMRRDQVLKVCLNHYLTAEMEFTRKTEKTYLWAAADFSEGEPARELLTARFKNSEIANSFKEAIDNAKKFIGVINATKEAASSHSRTDAVNVSTPLEDFSFKLSSSSSPSNAFSLSERFGTPPSSVSRSLFGNSPKGAEEGNGSDDIVVVCQKETTSEKKDMAMKLQLPPQFFLYEEKPNCPGCRGCEKDDLKADSEVQVVYHVQPSTEQIDRAKKLFLPPTFFLYENAPPCPGCYGCRDEIPKLTMESPQKDKENVTEVKELPTQSESAEELPFSSSKVASISFADLASQKQNLFKTPAPANKTFTFQGAGTPIFGNVQSTSADSAEDDHVAPSADVHFDPVVPLPALVDVKTGEEDETVLFCNRAKLYRFDNGAHVWKERGVGDFKILKHASKNLFRILMRREQIHKVACNHYISSHMVLEPLKTSTNALVWMAVDYAEEKPVTEKFAVRFKTKELLDEFKRIFEDCQRQIKTKDASKQAGESGTALSSAAVPASAKEEGSSAECTLLKVVQHDLSGLMGQPGTVHSETSSVTAEENQESERSVTSEEATADEGDDDDDYEDEEDDIMFDKRVSLAVKEGDSNDYVPLGLGVLQILYDDSFFGAKIVVTDDSGNKMCYHAIAIQTSLRTVKKEAFWSALDISVNPSRKRHFRATFSSLEAVAEFSHAFEEGKHLAVESAVVENED